VLTTLLDIAAGWPAPVVLAVVAALLVVESGMLVGIAVPGTTLLVALGLWSHTAPAALLPAAIATAVATVAGAHLSWWRGRTGAALPALRGRHLRTIRVRARQAAAWLAGRGPVATAALLVCGHWASAARLLMPRVAGSAGVPYRIAGPALVISGSAWAGTLVLLGNRVGPLVLTHAGWTPVVIVVLLIGALVLRGRHPRQGPDGSGLIEVPSADPPGRGARPGAARPERPGPADPARRADGPDRT
jgi:membrane-associated protein